MTKTDTRRRRRRRVVLVVLAVVLVGASALAARLFVWPSLPPLPDKADAIIQLGGPGNRRSVALDLVREGRAPVAAISVSDEERAVAGWCDDGRLRGVPVICFHSEPFTTRGEARSIEQLAREHGWHSVILVTSPDQAKRAELRVRRCYPGQIFVATAHLPWYWYPGQVLYQAAAMVKAYTIETSC
ncbi:YdcF family protein [Paractinoplanes globisporus]|uniref:YdcF family protein n=1 Tax=Paractinoplanes globisporus TaxID=113565 RepID=A0ABW6W3J9_9ACTN|nr:YdcF family protein [Actinoplanes globisporus]